MTIEDVHLPDWYKGPAAEKPGMGRVLYTTNRHPIFYQLILKCGCTFLRNLLYHIDHDRIHPAASRIHAYDHDFVKAAHVPHRVIRDEGVLFAVVRSPIDRFLSLYFDKIADLSNETDGWMRRRIGQGAGLTLSEGLGLQDHRDNCLRMLDWLRLNLDEGQGGKTNPHWQRQSVSLRRLKGLDPHLIPLEQLHERLANLLLGHVPDIRDRMEAVTQRNVSRKLFSKEEFVTPELQQLADAIYREDAEYHQLALVRERG